MASNNNNNNNDLYNPATIFDEAGDDLVQRVDHDDQMVTNAEQAYQHKTLLKIVTVDETFTGTVHNITSRDEAHLITFINQSYDSKPYQAEQHYFTFDIISMTPLRNNETADESDFDIISESSQLQAMDQNQPLSPQPAQPSQPSQHTQSGPAELTPTDQTQSYPDIPFYPTPDFDYVLPIQEDNTVDIDFLKITWKTKNPSSPTFT